MRIFIPRELAADETRVPVVPEMAAKLKTLGAELIIETGLGATIHRADAEYTTAGAEVTTNRRQALSDADIVLRLRKPPVDEVPLLRPGSIHVSYLDPFNESDLIRQLAAAGVSAISVEMIPRSTLAQKMDVLSSQANLAGYLAVIVAANHLDKIFPMMMTPAGTIQPARVLIIGVGVAGLQAIATAKRLGARVEAFDTRPVVEEQVKSLGAKFIKVDLGETGQTEQGYAKALTEEQLAKQRDVMAKQCTLADVVITTAQVFGRKAPVILTTEILKQMRPGSLVVDLAVETGGNVECSKLDEIVEVDGVRVIGFGNMAGRAATPASEMYSNNIGSFVEHFWNKESGRFELNPQDDLLKGCLVTHDGSIVNETLRKHLGL